MLKIVLEFGGLAVVFAVAWLALRRERPPGPVESGDDAFLRNVHALTDSTREREPYDPEASKKPILGPARDRC